MPESVTGLKRVEEELVAILGLVRDRPEAVRSAVLRISGSQPGVPDPVYLAPTERSTFVARAAEELGVPSEQLLSLYRIVTGVVRVDEL